MLETTFARSRIGMFIRCHPLLDHVATSQHSLFPASLSVGCYVAPMQAVTGLARRLIAHEADPEFRTQLLQRDNLNGGREFVWLDEYYYAGVAFFNTYSIFF